MLSRTVSSGNTVALQWQSSSLSPATSYRLEAGSASGARDIAVIDVSTTTFSTANVPSGVYFVRVRAVSSGGTSAPSNEFILVVP